MGTAAWGGSGEGKCFPCHGFLVAAPLVFSQPAPPNYCETKTVGGVSYTFVREDTTAISYSCLSPCVYERDDQPGTAFCFAQGDQQVVCGDDSAGTEGGEEGEDNIEATVKSLIDAGTCDGVSYASDATTDECGDAATSYYKEFMYNGKRVIVSNNIPDHPAEQDALAPNPNIRCAGWQFVQLEVDPEVGDTVTDTGLGTIGLAVTGGAFFNHLSNPDGSLAMPNEGPSLDSCLGHSAPIMGGGEGGAPGGPGGPPGGGPPAGGPPGGGPPGSGGPPGGRFKRQTEEEEDVPHG